MNGSDSPALPTFLGVPEAELPSPARVVVLPVPFEATTSYETGTRLGPQAILAASQQVELYDPDHGCEGLYRYGIRTLPALQPPAGRAGAAGSAGGGAGGGAAEGGTDIPAFLERLARAVEAPARAGAFVLALGGEHTLSVGVGRGLKRAVGEELAVVQFDAHCDLRASYLGEAFSHACAARRLLEEGLGPLVQVGIRSYSQEEARFLAEHPEQVRVISAARVHREPEAVARELALAVRGRKVFLTLDVDALDPAVIPATGTPEPDGLSWREALVLLRAVTGGAQVAGMDCVELAPRPGLHHAEFSVASLLYRLLNDLFAGPAPARPLSV